MKEYIVQKGDTLYGISRSHNTSVQKIRELNNLKSDTLKIGQTLILSKEEETNPNEKVTYTVQKGDSLYQIAQKYNCTVDNIARYNNLSSYNLSIGQKLVIPCSLKKEDGLPSYITYQVKKGDSLYSIAQKYNLSVDKLKRDNNLTSDTLSIGMKLKIETEEIEECYGSDGMVSETIYVVKKGDSLYKIAKQYGVSVSEIISRNGLTTNALQIGQELVIPSNGITYTVQKGDNLYSIARKFSTSVSEIQRKNNLSSTLLSVGQTLII